MHVASRSPSRMASASCLKGRLALTLSGFEDGNRRELELLALRHLHQAKLGLMVLLLVSLFSDEYQTSHSSSRNENGIKVVNSDGP